MQQILVYADSLSWGIVPDTRRRWPFTTRWPGVMEQALVNAGHDVRVIEDCLNGRRTVWEDPFKPGRNGRCSRDPHRGAPADPRTKRRHRAKVRGCCPEVRRPRRCIVSPREGTRLRVLRCCDGDDPSRVDGVHLDSDQHQQLGLAMAGVVGAILQRASQLEQEI
jgi:lysophospholipase L1-like esterase